MEKQYNGVYLKSFLKRNNMSKEEFLNKIDVSARMMYAYTGNTTKMPKIVVEFMDLVDELREFKTATKKILQA